MMGEAAQLRMSEACAKRFILASKAGEPTRNLQSILEMVPKQDIMKWTDETGFDILHHTILHDNGEAMDLLLKLGYFSRPYEPKVNLYTHFAARLGHRTPLTVLIQHRPDDFRLCMQPLIMPEIYANSPGSCRRDITKSPVPSVALKSLIVPGITPLGSPRKHTPHGSPRKRTPPKITPEDSKDVEQSGGITPKERLKFDLDVNTLKPLLMTPLDVAACAKHMHCVKLLLDTCILKLNPDTPSKGYLTLAALADSPLALKLLLAEKAENRLKEDKREKEDWKDFKCAVDICLQKIRPECIDLLLTQSNVDIKRLFKNISFYHILYTFSASYGKGAYERLPEMTRVLIKHKHDVMATLPPRTYPLYSLITHAFCIDDYSNSKHYIACMRMLLMEGADPNFDEVAFEKKIMQTQGIRFVAGRNAFSSALHCLIETVETFAEYLESRALAVKFVEECADVLTQNKADVSKVGRIGDARSDLQGNVLHQYAKSSVTIGVDQPIIHCILRYGAEPDIKIQGRYAINVYFDKLFEHLSTCDANTYLKFQPHAEVFLNLLCNYMSPSCIRDALVIFNHSHGRSTSNQVQYYVKKVRALLELRSKTVLSLRRLASWRVWKLCGKRADNVRQLKVSVELKTLILPIV